jgi:peptidoglycan/LPS O-acetylase OafA/YrhL
MLDGLRAIAVMLVIAIHVGLLAAGYIGVDVFLPLSGFLITALLYEEWERTGEISLRRFYERRVRRLLPALLLLVGGYALVMIVIDPFHGQWPTGKLIATTLLLVNNWAATLAPRHGEVLGALSPTWTLAQEGQFCLLWPPVLWLLFRLHLRPGTVLALLVLAMLALLAADPIAQHAYADYNAYTSPFNRGAELLLGSAAAIVWRERLVPSPLRWSITGWILVGGLAFVVAGAKPSVPTWYMITAALSAMLIINLLSQPEPTNDSHRRRSTPTVLPSPLGRVLSSRPLTYTGKISYGIYMFHVPIYYLVWTYAPVGPTYLYWPIVFGLGFIAAAASWELVESPILRRPWPRRRRTPSSAHLATHRRLAMRGGH